MTDLHPVHSGDPLRIKASTYNAILAATKAHQQSSMGIGAKGETLAYPSAVFPIKNISGSDVSRFGILGIDDSLFDPSTDLASFKNSPALQGTTPASGHEGKFTICLTPIANGEIGKGLLAGVCPVQINITDSSHEYAEISSGVSSHLVSSPTGSARTLWAESGTGILWALIRLGDAAGGGGGGDNDDWLSISGSWWIDVGKKVVLSKQYISKEDWRGRVLGVSLLTDTVVGGQTPADVDTDSYSGSYSIAYYGTDWNPALDDDLRAFDGGTFAVRIERGTGFLYYRTGWPGLLHRHQFRFTINATIAIKSTDAGVPHFSATYVVTGDNNTQIDHEALYYFAGVASSNTDDYKLYVNIVDDGGGDFHLNFYSTADRSTTLVAHTAPFSTAGSKSIIADGSSGLYGTIPMLSPFAADADITIQWPIPD